MHDRNRLFVFRPSRIETDKKRTEPKRFGSIRFSRRFGRNTWCFTNKSVKSLNFYTISDLNFRAKNLKEMRAKIWNLLQSKIAKGLKDNVRMGFLPN